MLPITNIKIIRDALISEGITNPSLIKGILACMAKECGLKPKSEYSYKNTANSRLRMLFGDRLKHYTEEQLFLLKKEDVKFYDAIYGNMYGNTAPEDGFKYRGRGFNGMTFKEAYIKATTNTGIDFVNNPDLMNDPIHSAKVSANFFKRRFRDGQSTISKRFKVFDINTIKDDKLATQIAVNANAGWLKDKRGTEAEKHAFDYLNEVTTAYNLITL